MMHSGARARGISQSVLLNASRYKKHDYNFLYIWLRGGDMYGFGDIKPFMK